MIKKVSVLALSLCWFLVYTGFKGHVRVNVFQNNNKKINSKNTKFVVHRFAIARNMLEMKYPDVYGDFKCLKIAVKEISNKTFACSYSGI